VRHRPPLRHATAVIGGEKVFSTTVGEPVAGVPAVVCVHGLGVGSRYFVPLMRRLAPHTRALAPDLPGFGRSSNPRRVYDIDQLAAALDQWLDLQAFERPPVVVANSMGCQVAAALLDGRPERASALLLIGPTIDANGRTASSQVWRLFRAMPFERVALVPLVAYEYLRCGPRRLLGSLRHALRDPLEADLPRIAVPAIVVRGERDVIASDEWVRQAAALLPSGEAVTLPQTGHAVNFSAPDRLVPHVLRLLHAAQPTRTSRS
jgi:pimeloyl-ACP methyl ester carboxylesterase